jgi:hypothetical protein
MRLIYQARLYHPLVGGFFIIQLIFLHFLLSYTILLSLQIHFLAHLEQNLLWHRLDVLTRCFHLW